MRQSNSRPTTAGWSGSTTSLTKWPAMAGLLTPTGAAGTTPVLPGKNLTAIDLEANKLRPKIVAQEREILYENVLKQKLHNNAYRDENTKLKTRLAIFEVELRQRERVIDELLVKPDAIANLTSGATTSAVALATVGGNFAKMKKFESHLTQNLKRRIKEMQVIIATKSQELDTLKRNIKTTKQNEMEVELRSYMEECTRLRQQLEEVIKSKDTFADPEELKIIESRFANQEQIINGLRIENTQFLNTIASKDEEILKLRELFSDTAKRNRARSSNNKDTLKSKKLLRDKD
jgi:hypothetical protein